MADIMDISGLTAPAVDPMDLDTPEPVNVQNTQTMLHTLAQTPGPTSIFNKTPQPSPLRRPLATALGIQKPKRSGPVDLARFVRPYRRINPPYRISNVPVERTRRKGSVLERRPFNPSSLPEPAKSASAFGNHRPLITKDGLVEIKSAPHPVTTHDRVFDTDEYERLRPTSGSGTMSRDLPSTPKRPNTSGHSQSRDAGAISSAFATGQVSTQNTNPTTSFTSPQHPDICSEVPGHWPASTPVVRQSTSSAHFDFQPTATQSAVTGNEDTLMTGGIIVAPTGDSAKTIVPISPAGTIIPQDHYYDLANIMPLDITHDPQREKSLTTFSERTLSRHSVLRETLQNSFSKTFRFAHGAGQTLTRCALVVYQKVLSASSQIHTQQESLDISSKFSLGLSYLLDKVGLGAGQRSKRPLGRQPSRSPLKPRVANSRIQKRPGKKVQQTVIEWPDGIPWLPKNPPRKPSIAEILGFETPGLVEPLPKSSEPVMPEEYEVTERTYLSDPYASNIAGRTTSKIDEQEAAQVEEHAASQLEEREASKVEESKAEESKVEDEAIEAASITGDETPKLVFRPRLAPWLGPAPGTAFDEDLDYMDREGPVTFTPTWKLRPTEPWPVVDDMRRWDEEESVVQEEEEEVQEYNPFNPANNRKPVKAPETPVQIKVEDRKEAEARKEDEVQSDRGGLSSDLALVTEHHPAVHWFEADTPMGRPVSSVRLFHPSSPVIPPGRSPPVYEREWREIERKKAEVKRLAEEERRAKERAVRPLLDEWEARVDESMTAADSVQLATTVAGHPLTRRDLFTCYRTGAWLNDEVINGYLSLVVDYLSRKSGTSAKDKDVSKTPKYHAFNSFFFSNLRDKGFSAIRRWTKRAKIGGESLLQVDTVFVPVHNGAHWTLIVVRPKERTIAHYDSLGSLSASFIKLIKEWLRGELGTLYKDDEWHILPSISPQQDNGSDCGVFLLTTAKAVAVGVDPIRYGPTDITILRKKIIAELMNGGLKGEFAPVGEYGEIGL